MSRPGPHRSRSLHLSETSFFNAAIQAISKSETTSADNDNDKSIQVAKSFLQQACPELLNVLDTNNDKNSSMDRLIKVGRNVTSTLKLFHDGEESSSLDIDNASSKLKMDESLALLADECHELASLLENNNNNNDKIPTVRFGKTELQMPILTLGCMRFQQSWNRDNAMVVDRMELVQQPCQDNLMEILKYAISMGVTHIETAKGYGSSELQLGEALQTLFKQGFVKREDLIIQTKGGISSSMTIQEYRQQVLDQLALLQLDYVDLFSVHGINSDDHLKWLFDNHNVSKGNLMEALKELKREGKIRHIGFSTHGHGDLIERCILTNEFEYVNLHYHFCGSYTTSGDGNANLSNIRLAQEHDMGVFCISPYDKGGRVYCPSNKIRSLTLPDMEPMAFASTWLWQHSQFDKEQQAPIHTIVCGAARPSDLDQPILAALKLGKLDTNEKRERIQLRLNQAMIDAVGKEFAETWHVGLPNWSRASQGTQLGNIVWLHNVIKAFGLLEFAKERYAPMETNLSKWDPTCSKEDNVAKNMDPSFGWCPGCAIDEKMDYSGDLNKCPVENQQQLLDAIQFVHKWCAKQLFDKNEEQEDEKKQEELDIPFDWQDSYDMRPWTAFPER